MVHLEKCLCPVCNCILLLKSQSGKCSCSLSSLSFFKITFYNHTPLESIWLGSQIWVNVGELKPLSLKKLIFTVETDQIYIHKFVFYVVTGIGLSSKSPNCMYFRRPVNIHDGSVWHWECDALFLYILRSCVLYCMWQWCWFLSTILLMWLINFLLCCFFKAGFWVVLFMWFALEQIVRLNKPTVPGWSRKHLDQWSPMSPLSLWL